MKNQPQPELFAERPVRSDFAQQNSSYAVRRIMTVLALLLLVGGGLYWSLGATPKSDPIDIPTIKAEGAYKQRPAQPGGIEIPHQDVQVYQELDNKDLSKTQVEHLLPPPETPLPQVEQLKPEPVPAPVAVAPSPAPVEIKATENPPSVPTPAPAVPVVAAVPTQPQKYAPPVMHEAPEKQTAPAINKVLKDLAVTPKTEATSGTLIQLASLPDSAMAQETVIKLQAKYASILGTAHLRSVKADLGAKGIYYRIQTQPLSDQRAKGVCSALKNLKAGCLIVRQ